MSETTRQTLLQRLQKEPDNDRAWQEFSDTYTPYLRAFILRMSVRPADANDLVQDVLLKVWKNVGSFHYDRQRCRFSSWLTTVARNTVLNFFDKANRRPADQAGPLLSQPGQTAELEKIAEDEWKRFIATQAWEKVQQQFSPEQCEVYQQENECRSLRSQTSRFISEFRVSTISS